MNAGTTAERAYHELKDVILSGTIRPGTRLEPARLADELTSSVTPVRDALHRLAGERLVEMRTSDGFHLPLLTEALLGDLYRWNDELIRIALRHRRRSKLIAGDGQRPSNAAGVFAAIGQATRNIPIEAHVASSNAMLALARHAESSVLGGIEEEISEIWTAFTNSKNTLKTLIQGYHNKRLLHIPEIINAVNQRKANPKQ